MTTSFIRVNPGDVITAAQWNQVLSALEDLYSQIGTVSNTQVSITGFVPPGPVKVGDQVTILGRNFQYSIGAQQVYFGGLPVNTFLLGSSDTQLVVNVPALTNLPDQGQSVSVTVYNRSGSDTQPITVLPLPVAVVGTVPIAAVPFTGTPTAGSSTTLPFVITSQLGVTRSVSVNATVTPSAWQGFLQLQTSGGAALGQLSMTPNSAVGFNAVLAIPADATPATAFSVTIDALDTLTGNSLGSSGIQQYTVGQASQTDPNIQFGAMSLVDASVGQFGALAGNRITLPANAYATIEVDVAYKVAAKYSAVAQLMSANGWQVTMLVPEAGTNLDFSNGAPPLTTISFKIEALGTPTSGGQLQIQSQTVGGSLSTTLGFTLTAG